MNGMIRIEIDGLPLNAWTTNAIKKIQASGRKRVFFVDEDLDENNANGRFGGGMFDGGEFGDDFSAKGVGDDGGDGVAKAYSKGLIGESEMVTSMAFGGVGELGLLEGGGVLISSSLVKLMTSGFFQMVLMVIIGLLQVLVEEEDAMEEKRLNKMEIVDLRFGVIMANVKDLSPTQCIKETKKECRLDLFAFVVGDLDFVEVVDEQLYEECHLYLQAFGRVGELGLLEGGGVVISSSLVKLMTSGFFQMVLMVITGFLQVLVEEEDAMEEKRLNKMEIVPEFARKTITMAHVHTISLTKTVYNIGRRRREVMQNMSMKGKLRIVSLKMMVYSTGRLSELV
ncbi:hypothetical protein Tco_0201025 [Tanacetum coccineum]